MPKEKKKPLEDNTYCTVYLNTGKIFLHCNAVEKILLQLVAAVRVLARGGLVN
jgi:hypothetical protein